ncbi:MAG: PBP1A family penicillin-binding protein [Candidatus Marinimicrobia bacterium]|nr:PBP1A family penicillin-binding protein [Candidatus Neomarinimicrobiota bacterium]MBL7022807.1 PBP1A family penicillin-binding protein [Candidatus Neomarinimicrobiota bacterium]MBL7109374.1 PBP1A family penicillin-binding protein [Candidatus Neomarinimicrobiota bacterium]
MTIKNKKNWKKVFINTFLFLFTLFLGGIIYLIILAEDLPSLTKLRQFNPETVTKIMSTDGQLIKELYTFKRDVVPIGKIPRNLINALISMEDHRFYDHSGVSIRGILRAVIIDIVTMSRKQGASTITQQLARNMYDTIGFQKTITRKLKELLTAIQIEKTYTKSEIMELYLNSVYFGHGTYGVQTASKYYFGKNVNELNLNECATLIGLLPAPAHYSPVNHPEKANWRRNLVLSVMNRREYISDSEFEIVKSSPLSEKTDTEDLGHAPYFSEYIRRELEKIDEELGINLYRDGLVIHTTLDMEIQKALEDAFLSGMDKNQSVLNNEFLNNKEKLENALKPSGFDIDSVKQILSNSKTIPGVLRNQFLVQGAAVVINPKNGYILGMIGGRQEDEYVDHFNRSVQAKRQPGSVFKPFIYLTALENKHKPTTQLLNQPLVKFIDDTTLWNPQNHDGSTGLLTTLRDGLRRSLNLVSVRVVQELVTPKEVKENAKLFGLTTNIRAFESIALGVSEVYPLEITSAYSVFANNGIYSRPFAITKIEDQYGSNMHEVIKKRIDDDYRLHRISYKEKENKEEKLKEIFSQFIPNSSEIKDEATIYLLRDMMRSVVDAGTGGALRWKYKFKRPAAGKTGTTDSKTDAWFVGYTPQIAMGVWVGVDDPSVSLGEKQFGSVAALPIWAKAIKQIYAVKGYPEEDWERPDGIVELEICTETYEKTTRWCPGDTRMTEIFMTDNQPKGACSKHQSPFSRFQDE